MNLSVFYVLGIYPMIKEIKNLKIAFVMLLVLSNSRLFAVDTQGFELAGLTGSESVVVQQDPNTEEQFCKLVQDFLNSKSMTIKQHGRIAISKNLFNFFVPLVTVLIACIIFKNSAYPICIVAVLANLCQFAVDDIFRFGDDSFLALSKINEFATKLTPKQRIELIESSSLLIKQIEEKLLYEKSAENFIDGKLPQILGFLSDLGGLIATATISVASCVELAKSLQQRKSDVNGKSGLNNVKLNQNIMANSLFLGCAVLILLGKLAQAGYNYKTSLANKKLLLVQNILKVFRFEH